MRKSILGLFAGAVTTAGVLVAYAYLVLPWLLASLRENPNDSDSKYIIIWTVPATLFLGCYLTCRIAGRYEIGLAWIWSLASAGIYVGGSILFPSRFRAPLLPNFSMGDLDTWLYLAMLAGVPFLVARRVRGQKKPRTADEERTEALRELASDGLENGSEIIREVVRHLRH